MEAGKVGEVGRTSWEELAHQRFKDTASSLGRQLLPEEENRFLEQEVEDHLSKMLGGENKPPAMGRASNNMK